MEADAPLDTMSLQALMDAHAAEREAMKPHRERMAVLHHEITRREHAQHGQKRNFDANLDQTVKH